MDYEHIERVENGDANWILPGECPANSSGVDLMDIAPLPLARSMKRI